MLFYACLNSWDGITFNVIFEWKTLIYIRNMKIFIMPSITEKKTGSTTTDSHGRSFSEGTTKMGYDTTLGENIKISDDSESTTATKSINVKPIDINESTTN